jgi:hypothetical protein
MHDPSAMPEPDESQASMLFGMVVQMRSIAPACISIKTNTEQHFASKVQHRTSWNLPVQTSNPMC